MTVLVADISNNQRTVPMHVLAHDVHGCYSKATQGIGFVDGFVHERRRDALALRLPFGLYHFAGWEDAAGAAHFGSPREEAEHFLTVAGKLHRTDLVPALDLEIGHAPALHRWALEWLNRVENELGIAPLLYSYGAYIAELGLDYPTRGGVWDAGYGRNDGRDYGVTPPHPYRRVRLHQFTSAGVLRGVPVHVDLSHGPALPFAHPLRATTRRRPLGSLCGGGGRFLLA